MDLSRRMLIGAAAAAPAVAALAKESAVAAEPVFGPAPDEAHLLFNENPYGPAPSAIRAMAEAASAGCYYPDAANERLAAMIAERFRVKPEQVAIGNGSFELLSRIGLDWGAKGAIVCPELMFDEPIRQAEGRGARLVRVPLAADMGVDLAAIAAAVTPDTAMVYLCNPNNPTGMLIEPAALRGFIRALPPQVTVLIDEAYNELTNAPEQASVVDLVREGRNVIVTRTFSKIYGMAGLRVGYSISSVENAERIRRRANTIGCATPSLAAALACYEDTGFMRFSKEKVLEARGILLDAIKSAGLRALPSQANFLFVEVPDANALRDAMAKRGIAIRGAYGKWARWSRVSTGKIEHVRRYAEALPQLVRA